MAKRSYSSRPPPSAPLTGGANRGGDKNSNPDGTEPQLSQPPPPQPQARGPIGRVRGYVDQCHEHFYLVSPTTPLPEGYSGCYIKINKSSLPEGLLPLGHLDEVDCSLNIHVKQKPVASGFRILRYNHSVSLSEITSYLERAVSFSHQRPIKTEWIIPVASCTGLWELLGRTCVRSNVYQCVLLHLHVIQHATIREDAKNCTNTLFSTKYASCKGLLAELLKDQSDSSLIGYLVLVIRTCPGLVRKISDILEWRSRTYDDVRDSETILLYSLLKESTRVLSSLLNDANQDTNALPWDFGTEPQLSQPPPPQPQARGPIGRVRGYVDQCHEHFYLVSPTTPLPEGYSGRYIKINKSSLPEGLLPLGHLDEVDCSLNIHVKQKPVASGFRILRYNHSVSLSEITSYLERAVSFSHQRPIKTEWIIPVASCTGLWELLGRTCVRSNVYQCVLLHLRVIQHATIREDAKNCTNTLFSTKYASWKGPLAELLKDQSGSSLIGYLVLVIRTCPGLVRKISDILEWRSRTYDDVRDSEAILLYSLLKESTRVLSSLLNDANQDTNALPWDSLPLVPHVSELLSEHFIQTTLSPVKANEPYEDFEEYMDTYFRLLRADCFLSIAKGIQGFLNEKIDLRDMNIFYDLCLTGLYLEPLEGSLVIVLRIKPLDTKKRWERSSGLMQGNLVCISPTGKFDDPLFASVRDHQVLEGSSKEIEVSIQPIQGELVNQTCGRIIKALMTNGKSGILVESPVYYVSVVPVLKALQLKYAGIPFEDEIVFGNSDEVVTSLPHTTQMMSLVDSFQKDCSTKRSFRWGEFQLDPTQTQAFCHGLTHKVTLIQGPPGTGKTFIGSEILRAILKKPLGKPILVLTYKNHALDEFVKRMQGICGETNVVRVGGKSKDPEIEAVTLSTLRKTPKSKALFVEFKKVIDDQVELERQIFELLPKLNQATNLDLDAFYSKFSFDELEAFMQEVPWEEIKKHFDRKNASSVKNMLYNLNKGLELFCALECDEVLHLWKAAMTHWLPSNQAILTQQSSLSQKIRIKIENIQKPRTQKEPEGKLAGKPKEVQDDEEDEEEVKEMEKERKRLTEVSERRKVFSFATQPGPSSIGLKSFSAESIPIVTTPTMGVTTEPEGEEGSEATEVSSEPPRSFYFDNMWNLTTEQRTSLVAQVLCDQVDAKLGLLDTLMAAYQSLGQKRRTFERLHEKSIVEDKAILAMTITGASIHHELLSLLEPEVVLVEEAAEILEPQLIAALGPWTKHLILIGDHQQLRPQVQNMEMKKLNFEISLFERLVNLNFPHVTLQNQNRMRPAMAKMLLDIYPNLQSNLSRVLLNQVPKCAVNSMWFWDVPSKEIADRGFSNPLEAEVIVALTTFLLNHGVTGKQITVLGAYLGQTRLLRQELKREGARYPVLYFANSIPLPANTPKPSSQAKPGSAQQKVDRELLIRVSTIDSYQGDENDIVLISLVRSNSELKAGFLKELNRRCVSQSRARCMFVYVGNFQLVQSIPTWKNFTKKLLDNGSVGSAISLRCEYHPDSMIFATSGKDLRRKAASIFCSSACSIDMPCRDHPCPNPCQPAHLHEKCEVKVNFQCVYGHNLTKLCYQNASSITCVADVSYVLPCKHAVMKKCFQDGRSILCYAQVQRYSTCGLHTTDVHCHKSSSPITCKRPCPKLLACKHICQGICGTPCTPDTCRFCAEIRKQEEKRKLEEERKKKEAIIKETEDIIVRLSKELLRSDASVRFITELERTSAEYLSVQDRVVKYIQPTHNWYPTITKVEKITHRKLELEFLKAQKEMFDPTFKDLKFHGTSKEGVDGITTDGFRLPDKSGMYGKGIYFATDSSKSAQDMYTKQSNMLLLCEVLLGCTYNASKNVDMTLEKLRLERCDSLFAKRNTKDQGGVQHDEFVVYNPRQAMPRYIIHYSTIITTMSNTTVPQTTQSFFARLLRRHTVTDLLPKRTYDPTDPYDNAFRVTEAQFLRLQNSNHLFGNKKLVKVGYVQNPELEKQFLSKKDSLQKIFGKGRPEAQEILVFHGTTSDQNIDTIVARNFDLSKIKRCAYGYGIYFSELPDVSLSYAGSTNKLLLCRLLPGRTQPSTGASTSLKFGFHSIGANPDHGGYYQIMVITDMSQVLPTSILHLA